MTARRLLSLVAVIGLGVTIATIAVAALEAGLGIADASAVYLVAVVVSAMLAGTVAGVGTAIAAVVTYNLLFLEPVLTLKVAHPGEWVSLLLLSFVGISVGQLVSIQRRRADEAMRREREADDLYAVSRSLATRTSTEDALDGIAPILAERARLDRVWFGFGPNPVRERVVGDTGTGPISGDPFYTQLRRTPSGDPREWVRVHASGRASGPGARGKLRHRVAIEAGGSPIGSLWGERDRSEPPLDHSVSRLLAAAADQIGQAMHQDRLAARAAEARIAQESDALKSVLVENVSHDLRIPLAAIRAHAGPLIDPSVRPQEAQVREAGIAIDLEAAKLDRLVANLLDLGRIQGGMLQAHLEAVELREVVGRAVSDLADQGTGQESQDRVQIRLDETWVDADPLLLQQVITNVLENAIRHTPPGTRVLVTASGDEVPSRVRLSIEDDGPGVAADVMARLFERFYRGERRNSALRPGSGIGLAVARGFVEAMGGRIDARESDLGGLAIDIRLVAMTLPDDLTSGHSP